jgi:hypothetical protein
LYCKSNNITSLDLSNNILLCKQPPYDELWCCANHNLNSIKLPNTTNNLSFSWAWLTDDCANDGTVQKAANTTIGGTKPTNWTEVPY